MEWDREDASKAKDVAEKKFESGDYLGARKFALKAKSLYPDFDNIQHMIAALNVYISANDDRVGGESDWYKVLNVVDLNADVEVIKKQYKKMSLLVHPDKNKWKGADGAFKIISEAWCLLSDKKKRYVFDQKIRSTPKSNSYYKKATAATQKPKADSEKEDRSSKASTGKSNSNKKSKRSRSTTRKPRAWEEDQSSTPTTPSQQPKRPATFWTCCEYCKWKREYFRIYLKQSLTCPSCGREFYAKECPNPQTTPEKDACSTKPFQHYQAQYMHFSKQCQSSAKKQTTSSQHWKNPFAETDHEAPNAARETFLKSTLDAIRKEELERNQADGQAKRRRKGR